MDRTHKIYNAYFSEFVANEMMHATDVQKKKLSDRERKIFRSETEIKKWCHMQPFEFLLDMLQKLGKGWCLRVYNDENIANQVEFLTINTFQYPEQRVEVVEAAGRNGIHHLTNREMIMAGHMCAQNVHTQIYTLSMSVKSLSKRMQQLRLKGLRNGDLHDADHAIYDLNRMVLSQLNAVTWSQANVGIEEAELRVLCALFDKRNTALPVTEIEEKTRFEGKGMMLRQHMKNLETNGLIISDKTFGPKLFTNAKTTKGSRKYFYMITPKGIEVVMQYLDYIYEKTFPADK